MNADELAILRIELVDIEPLIWRRVAVRGSTSLATLHRIIQAAMGWLDYHLWEFTVDEVIYGIPDPDDISWGRMVERASAAKLAKLLGRGTTAFGYVYDMGDNWEHRVIVERIEAKQPDKLYPEFLGGERRCPPEDCGGLPATTNSSTTSPGRKRGKPARRKKRPSAGMAVPTIQTTLTRSKSASLSGASQKHHAKKPNR